MNDGMRYGRRTVIGPGTGRELLIYGLVDPRTQEIRYVGKSTSGMHRAIASANETRISHKGNWISKLRSLQLKPIPIVLQVVCNKDELNAAERFWITVGREALGKRFTNGTGGGDGGLSPTSEMLAIRTAAQKATFSRPEVRAKLSAAAVKKWSQPDIRARMEEGIRIAHARPEVKARHRASLKKAYTNPELRAKVGRGVTIAFSSSATRAAISVAVKAARARPEVMAKIRTSSKAANSCLDVRAKISASVKATKCRPDVRAKTSAVARVTNARSDVKARISDATKAMWACPGVREKIGAAIKAVWDDPQRKREILKKRRLSALLRKLRTDQQCCDIFTGIYEENSV